MCGLIKCRESLVSWRDKRVSLRLKDRFYKAVMRAVMLHKSECWAIDNTTEQRVNVAEMIMFR